jgi:hypothetical protein
MVATRASGPGDVHSHSMPGSKANARLRGAVERTLRVAGPGLDLLLAIGDRLSRVLDPGDHGYGVVRLPHDGESAPRGLEAHGPSASRTEGVR